MKRVAVRAKFVIWAFTLLLACAFVGYAKEDYPQRIISLGPSVTKALYLLGVEDKLVANTVHCVSPSLARDKAKIGTAIEVNIEKIFSLKPDLVLATSLTDPQAKEKLKNLGIKVIGFPAPRDFSDLCRQFLELGKLVGKEKNAEEIVKSTKKKVIFIKEKIKNLPWPKVFVQVGARPLVAATGHYFINDYIELAGAVNIAKEAKEGIYSREQVLAANPDVIIIATMGIAGEEEKRVWQSFKTLNAARFNRIYIIDSDELTSPTPASFVKTLDEIVRILHP